MALEPPLILAVVSVALMGAAAVSDVLWQRIADVYALLAAAAFAIATAWLPDPTARLAAGAAAGACVLALGFGAFAAGVMGGADGKLAAATALWVGPEGLAAFALNTALAGGALALAILLFRAFPAPSRDRAPRWARRLHRRRAGLPYGVAIAAGGALALRDAAWLGVS